MADDNIRNYKAARDAVRDYSDERSNNGRDPFEDTDPTYQKLNRAAGEAEAKLTPFQRWLHR
ncbi:hypothetical protein [Kutzneria albida]|uniref:Uncharacterized protein n=1 Tax=Kutzneria albida DSM 43870 TaxID=1449976 RepID=W5WAW7_9PSEU|nr:hypothetical protein [Kutzneria albida]AHH98273.1 hypothetical protein KALB_4911 [Kutzneria albida DSM 43870]